MDRAIPCGNKVCAQRVEQQRFHMHKERLRNVKSQVDASEPLATQMEHVRTNLKREQMLEERYSEIDRANRILLKKMSEIMKQPPLLTPRSERPPGPPSLNRDARKKELLRITKENQSILRRIQQAQPVYNHVELEGLHRRNVSYLKNCSEFPLVLRQTKKANNNSELVPLEAPRTARSSTATPREEEEKLGPGARCVWKDEMRIGQAQYLIEMSTDGRVLAICAHDASTRTTVELLLKEKTHRRLYRDVNGDYSGIAQRLRVDGNRLLLDEGPSPSLPLMSGSMPRSGPPMSARRQARTPEELDADAMVVLRDKTGSPGSVNAHIDVRSNGEAQVRLRGLTPSSSLWEAR